MIREHNLDCPWFELRLGQAVLQLDFARQVQP